MDATRANQTPPTQQFTPAQQRSSPPRTGGSAPRIGNRTAQTTAPAAAAASSSAITPLAIAKLSPNSPPSATNSAMPRITTPPPPPLVPSAVAKQGMRPTAPLPPPPPMPSSKSNPLSTLTLDQQNAIKTLSPVAPRASPSPPIPSSLPSSSTSQPAALSSLSPTPAASKASIATGTQPSQVTSRQQEMLYRSARGEKFSGDEFMDEAKKFSAELSKTPNPDPKALTTLHQLYDKAAAAYSALGMVEKAFQARSSAAQVIKFSPNHPLHNLSSAVKAQAAKQPAGQANYGAHFSNFDTGILKGGHIRVDARTVQEGKRESNLNIFQMRLSYLARENLNKSLSEIQQNVKIFNKNLPPGFKEVKITEIPYTFKGVDKNGKFTTAEGLKNKTTAYQIEFPGIGKVVIPKDPKYKTFYNDIQVEIPSDGLQPGEGIKRVHQMLAVLGCGPVLGEQKPEDNDRIKMAFVFRSFFPATATRMENKSDFYELPLGELRARMEKEVPESKEILKKYLDDPNQLESIEVYPGRSAWAIKDLGQQLRARGAVGLIQGIGGDSNSAQDAVFAIIVGGALSTLDRFQAGVIREGESCEQDIRSGGGDRVFMRLMNGRVMRDINDRGYLPLGGHYNVLYDCDVVNQGAYAYNSDSYGVRDPKDSEYATRQNLLQFASGASAPNNEVMIKNRVDPKHIRGVVVTDQYAKDNLIKRLNQAGITQIGGKSLSECIHVSLPIRLERKMWG